MDMSQSEYLKRTVNNALDKLKASMDTGPGGDNAVLAADEATLVYRLITERLGVIHHK
jgi:hypothetical protein